MAFRTTTHFPEGSPGSIQRDGYTAVDHLMSDLGRDLQDLGYTLLATDKQIYNPDDGYGILADNDFVREQLVHRSIVDEARRP